MSRQGNLVLAVGPCFAKEDSLGRSLRAEAMQLARVASQDEAALWLCENEPTVVLIDLTLKDGSPLAVADFCSYRRPEARVILLGGGELMADGSILRLVGNAHALVSGDMAGPDLSALVAFHGGSRNRMVLQ